MPSTSENLSSGRQLRKSAKQYAAPEFRYSGTDRCTPGSRLSSPMTPAPRPQSASPTCEPMKPAAPVTRTFIAQPPSHDLFLQPQEIQFARDLQSLFISFLTRQRRGNVPSPALPPQAAIRRSRLPPTPRPPLRSALPLAHPIKPAEFFSRRSQTVP